MPGYQPAGGELIVAPRVLKTLTIDNGASVSNSIYLAATNLLGFVMPAAWTSAALTIEVSNDGVTFYPCYDYAGAQAGYIASPSVSSAYAVDLSALLPWRYARFRSGTSAAPVNQLANRSIVVVTRGLA